MQININTDNSIDGSQDVKSKILELVEGPLHRFADRLTRVEVHLSDVNAHKGGKDIRCVVEVRPAGMEPVAVDAMGEDLAGATRSATAKAVRALDTRFGKRGR